MEILARRLTIITLLMTVFAISVAAAVETDARRHEKMQRYGTASACSLPVSCHTAL
ncbi:MULTISPECIES: hypothetical protein [Rhizobiaceae]|jgi:hypothetical protein|uniref:Uncharacterized protein n=2 Tax=Rhizobiaceae TaxID=82115 RepID=A0A285UDI7_9HYPH|nr:MULTISPECIES: hypothetical protein [Rhizobium]NVP54244.1 hypothetical protein [Rhizobium rhizolycopersici]SOC39975.1 hypothetical protein SAMN05892877_106293 [Rhizobium subbaraonis]